MINEINLQRYLISILREQASSSRKVLPLFEYGFKMHLQDLKELNVHTGFKRTIERYLEDPSRLTIKEVLAILRFYDIDSEPIIVFPEFSPSLTFVPNPIIELNPEDIITLISVDFIPEPIVEIDINSIKNTITFLPEPIITTDITGRLSVQYISKPIIDIDGSTLPLSITFVSKPIISTSSEGKLTISSISKPIISTDITGKLVVAYIAKPIIELDTNDIPLSINFIATPVVELDEDEVVLPPVEVIFIPKPYVFTGQSDLVTLSFIPKPIVMLEQETVQTSNYYYGWTGTSETLSRANVISDLYNATRINTMLAGTSPTTAGVLQTRNILGGQNTSSLPADNWNIPARDAQAFILMFMPLNVGVSPRTVVTTPTGGTLRVGTGKSDFFDAPLDIPITINGVSYAIYVSRDRTDMNAGTHNLIA